MKKRILCIVLAALFVATAIFFAIYNRYGNTYNYQNKDMSKYVGSDWTIEFIEGLYDGSVEYKHATEKDVQYAIAEAIAAKNADTYKESEGTFGLYDTLLANYYITTEIDGETVVISLPSKLAPGSKTGMQLGADTDFARMISTLLGKKVSDNSYVTFTAGNIYAGDNLYIDYSIKDGESGTYEKFTMEGTDYLESILPGLTAKFEEKKADVKIGTAVELKVTDAEGAEKTVSLTVKFASRAIIQDAGKALDGDHVFFEYKTGEEVKTTSWNGVVGATTTDENTSETKNTMDAKFGAGFEAALKGLTIGTEGEVKATLDGKEVTYKVKISYALPVDRAATDREGYKAAESFFELDYTYPEDSEAQSEAEIEVDGEKKKIDLAGKAVKLYVAVTNFYDMSYDYEGIMDVLKYSPGAEEKVDLYLSAYAKYLTAKKAYEDGIALTGDKALTEEKKAELKAAMDEAETKANEAKTAYETELGEGKTTTPDEAAVAAYDKYAEEVAQAELDNEYRYAVAQQVWEKLLPMADGAKLPSKAVKAAYKGLIDSHKETYYKNKTKDPYKQYSTFKSYLKGYLYSGKDYKAELTKEAEGIVRSNMVMFRLVEIYGVELDATQELMVSIYQQLGNDLYAESYEYAALFDNVMTEMTDHINPELVDPEADEHAGHDHD